MLTRPGKTIISDLTLRNEKRLDILVANLYHLRPVASGKAKIFDIFGVCRHVPIKHFSADRIFALCVLGGRGTPPHRPWLAAANEKLRIISPLR